MTTPTTKIKSAPKLIHHPSTVLDDLCAFDLTHNAWVQFDVRITDQLRRYEEAHQPNITRRGIRQSLGR